MGWLWWQWASGPWACSLLQLINPLGIGPKHNLVSWHFSGLEKSWPGCMVHDPMEPHWRQPGSLCSVSGGDTLMSQPALYELMGLSLAPCGHSHPTSCLISGSSTGMAVLYFLQAMNPGCCNPSSQWHCLSPRHLSSLDTGVETDLRPAVRIRQINFLTGALRVQGRLGFVSLHWHVVARTEAAQSHMGTGFYPSHLHFLITSKDAKQNIKLFSRVYYTCT